MESVVLPGREGVGRVVFFDQAITSINRFIDFAQLSYGSLGFIGTRDYIIDGTRGEYSFKTFNDVISRAQRVAKGLLSIGISQGDYVAIIAENRLEWVIAFFALVLCGAFSVPIHTSMDTAQIKEIVSQLGVKCYISSLKSINGGILDDIVKNEKISHASTLIVMDKGNIHDHLPNAIKSMKTVKSLLEVEKMAKDCESKLPMANPDDLVGVFFTSGTTGNPKGMYYTHACFLAQVAAVVELGHDASESESYYGFAPLSLVSEVFVLMIALRYGGKIGFPAEGSESFDDDLLAMRPTIFSAHASVFVRIYKRMLAETRSLKFKLSFAHSFKKKERALHLGNSSPWLDYLVFRPILSSIGLENLKVALVSGSILHQSVRNFIHVISSVPVVAVYGPSEAYPVFFGTNGLDGFTGKPLAHANVKVRECVDLGLKITDASNARGEILLKSSSRLMKYMGGEPIPSMDYLETGDVGEIVSGNMLRILGRVQDMIMLEGRGSSLDRDETVDPEEDEEVSEMVSCAKLESCYLLSPLIRQIIVFKGESEGLEALVVPDMKMISKLPESENDDGIHNSVELENEIGKALLSVARQEFLTEHVIGQVHIQGEEWTIEKGYLSANMCPRRDRLVKLVFRGK